MSTTHLDLIARAFGFQSEQHFNDVLAGRAPSALRDEQSAASNRAAAESRAQAQKQRKQEGRWARDKAHELKAAKR
ncbi:hypothetical protein [Nocardia sp. SC052]|uniref:hypothetical protein n=1 Tax=Nocardia sichangensis TaxID=3385975 RepID=UPI0039A10625